MDYTKFFTTAKRRDMGLSFTKCTDDAPQKLNDLVRKVHGYFDCMPNDWIYENIAEAFDWLATDKLEDVNMEADIYYHELNTWLNNPYAAGLCDEVMQEDRYDRFYSAIECAQIRAKYMIYEAVNEFLQEESAEEEAEEEKYDLLRDRDTDDTNEQKA
jgi:hypothetical protein